MIREIVQSAYLLNDHEINTHNKLEVNKQDRQDKSYHYTDLPDTCMLMQNH